MQVLNRRRFLTIAAAAGAWTLVGRTTHAQTTRHWLGTAVGARASIRLDHPDAGRIIEAVRGELERLEHIFSLYRTNSELSRLNRDGTLAFPSLEMVELLSMCGTIHEATSGLFDPTVQSLWSTYAEQHATGRAPDATAIHAALQRVGWPMVSISSERISFKKAGMSLTLNGIAQGYIADKVASLLRHNGLNNILIDTGEYYALGRMPLGGEWPIELASDQAPKAIRRVHLADAALASSAPLGTVFDTAGRVGHIIDPRTGLPATAQLPMVSVRAPTAARADAFSTAMCLMTIDEIHALASSRQDLQAIY